MRRSLLLALALCLFVIPAAAQTDPAPLTAEDVFAPNVEIRYVTPDEPHPDFAADDELRVMSLGGRVIPYPEGFEEVTIAQIDDETFLIENRVTINADEFQYESKRWLYNKSDDLFVEPRSQCQDRGFDRYLPEIVRQPWIIVTEDGADVLCNVLTGERTPSLPSERADFSFHYQYWYTTDDGILDVSPDGQSIVFSGWEREEIYSDSANSVLFHYDVKKGTFLELGIYSHAGAVYDEIDQWFGSEFAMIIADSCGQCAKSLYIADVTRENSLIHAMYSSFSPHFEDNPPRYVADDAWFMNEYYCQIFVFDVMTKQEKMIDSPVGCRPDYGTFEGVGYYRELGGKGETIVYLYDSRTEEQKELFRGEVEHIQWVSDDQQYAVLLLDDNGSIDDSPYAAFYMDPSHYGYTHWALVDLESDEILHTVPNNRLAFKTHYYDYDESVNHLGIYPLAAGSFVTNTCHALATLCDNELSEHVIITGNGIHSETLDYNPVVPLSGQNRVIINPDPANPRAGRDLYDVVTGEVIPFIKPLATDSYRLYVGIRETGEVYATLGAQSSEIQDIHFAISFDEDGTPVVTVKKPAVPFEFDVAAATPVVAISATPSMTYTPSLTPTRTPTSDPTCYLTVINDANLRNFPDADPDSESIVVGSAAVGFQLKAVGRHENPRDEFIWWKLSTGEWLREDFVDERGPCFVLRSIAPDSFDYIFITPTPTTPPTLTPTRTSTVTPTPVPACEMTVIMGANLRSEPDAGSAQVGSVAEGFELTVVGQFANAQDFFTWWKLDTGEWLREDFVDEQETCMHLAFVDASAPDFVFVTPTPSSTPTITATVTARATATPDLSASCTLTVVTGANLRAGPAVETEKVGSAAVDFVLTAVGQAENTQDFFTWWQLDTGEWIREDFVREGEGCEALPIVQP